MHRSTFGIDIGHHLVKLVELRYDPRRGRTLSTGTCVEIPRDNVAGRQPLVRTLKRIFPRRMRRTAQSALGVYGGPNVILKRIDLRSVSEGDFISAAEAESEQYLPLDEQDYIRGFTTTNPVVNAKSNGSELAFVGIRRSMCEFYDEVLMSSHKNPVELEAAGLALAATYQRASQRFDDRLIAILDIGESLTKITLLRNGHFYFYDEMEVGCRLVVSALRNKLSIALWPAVSLLAGSEAVGLTSDYAVNSVQSEIEAFVGQIRDLVWRARLHSQTWHFDRVFVCGGAAALPCIVDAMTPLFRFGVTVLDPFRGLAHQFRSLSKNMPAPPSSIFAVAMGLALRARFLSAKYGGESASPLPGHRRLLGH
ncbi:MAG: pilus assembly protein PilM [Candidatus Coatesbacteria bacterium]|nr:pilus assembly protein PilM [Candidatus Coatesbacteria bacterium]